VAAGQHGGVTAPHEEDPKDPFRLGDDPGWRPGPGGGPDGLIALRYLFLAFCSALLLIGVVVGFLASDTDRFAGGPSAWAVAAGVALVGALGLLFVRFVPVRLDCADELALARSWRSRFFARMAGAEASAFAGFVGFALTGAPALYPLGLSFTAVGFALAGPFRANLIRDQEQLALDGCPISLVPALRHTVSTDR